MDFRRQRAIGEHAADAARYFQPHVGYDHNWVIDKPLGQLGLAARLHEPVSGRIMEVLSTEPGLRLLRRQQPRGQRAARRRQGRPSL